MKTSKIILFSYIGLLAFAFLVFVIVLQAADKTYKEVDRKSNVIKKDLPDFKFIAVEGQNINLINDMNNYIEAVSHEKSKVSEINFSVLNDTLFIHPTSNALGVSVHFPRRSNLALVNKNAHIRVSSFNADTLNYIGTGNSEISGFSESKIGYVDANVKNSRFYAYQGTIGQLSLNADHGNINIRSKMSTASVIINNNSDVRLGNVDKIDLEKDETSKFFCNP